MLQKISRASLILGTFAQAMFSRRYESGDLIKGFRAPRAKAARHNPAGSKPAGDRGMHLPACNPGFRPMAHGKLGKKYPPSASKRVQRERQRGYARTTNLAAFHSGNYDNVPASLG